MHEPNSLPPPAGGMQPIYYFQITNRPIGGAVYHSQFPRLKCEHYLHRAEAVFALHLHNIIHFIDFVLEVFLLIFIIILLVYI